MNGSAVTRIEVVAVDAAGNESAASDLSLPIQHDTVAPSAPADLSGDSEDWFADSDKGIVWSDSIDDDSSIKEYRMQWSSTGTGGWSNFTPSVVTSDAMATVTFQGDRFVRVVAVDYAGNETASTEKSHVKLDNVKPATPAVTGGHDTNWYNTDQSFTWAPPVDESSGIASYDVYISTDGMFVDPPVNQLLNSYLVTAPVAAASTTWIKVVAIDKAGNVSSESTMSLPIKQDTIAPVAASSLGGTTGAAGSWVSSPSRTITWIAGSDDDSEVKQYRLETSPTDAAPWTANNTVSNLADSGGVTFQGSRYVRVVTVDNAGNESPSASILVELDNVAPSAASVGGGHPTAWYNINKNFAWAMPSDGAAGSGVVSYEIYDVTAGVPGVLIGAAQAGTSFTITAPVDGVQQTRVRVRSFDRAGNSTDSATSLTLRQDTQLPTGSIAGPVACSSFVTWAPTWTATYADGAGAGIGLYSWQLMEDGAPMAPPQVLSGTTASSFSPTPAFGFGPGMSYDVTLTVTDSAGNSTSVALGDDPAPRVCS